MIQKMKKLTILVTGKEYEQFLTDRTICFSCQFEALLFGYLHNCNLILYVL